MRLAAARSPVPLTHIGALLQEFPDKTELFCSYLSALADNEARAVASELTAACLGGRFRTEWESAWISRTFAHVFKRAPRKVLDVFRNAIDNPFGSWLHAVEAAKVLGARGELTRESLARLWNTCPPVFRSDLVVAAASLAGTHPWAEAFFQASQDDPIHVVVAKKMRKETKSPAAGTPVMPK